MPPRVALITTSFPRYGGDPSGHFVAAHARLLASDGAHVHVIAPGIPAPSDASLPITIHRCGGSALFAWPGAVERIRQDPSRIVALVPWMIRARRALRRLDPDRVFAHWIVPSLWPIAVEPPACRDLRGIAHGADVRLLLRLPAPLRARVVRRLLARHARITFVARRLREELLRALPPDLEAALLATSDVAPSPIELPDVRPRSAALRAAFLAQHGAGISRAIVLGRLVATKRVHLVIAALDRLDATQHLVVVGDGPERERLETSARGKAITWLGARDRSEALAHLAASDVLVCASAEEGAPTVVREARALGVPVVACPAGDLDLWAASDPGIALVSPDPSSIAAAWIRALRSRS